MVTGGGTRTCYLYILPYIQGQDSANAKKATKKKRLTGRGTRTGCTYILPYIQSQMQKKQKKTDSQEEELGQAASREPRSPQRSSPSRSWHT